MSIFCYAKEKHELITGLSGGVCKQILFTFTAFNKWLYLEQLTNGDGLFTDKS